MWILFSSGCSVLPELLTLLHEMLIPVSSDGAAVFWAKSMFITTVLFAVLWIVADLLKHLLEAYAKKLTSFTKTDLDDRILRSREEAVEITFPIRTVYLQQMEQQT